MFQGSYNRELHLYIIMMIWFMMWNMLQRCHELARANLMKSKQRRVTQQASKVNMPVFSKGVKYYYVMKRQVN